MGLEVYFYRLEGEKQGRFSLAAEVDFRYWKKRGKTLAEVHRTRSIRDAWALARGRKEKSPEPVTMPVDHEFAAWMEQANLLFPILSGRALLWQEVQNLVEKHLSGMDLKMMKRALQILILEQKCQLKPGVIKEGPVRRWRCERCGYQGAEIKATVCLSCGGECAVCEHCLLMGRSRACTPFFLFEPEERKPAKPASKEPAFSLTVNQQRVSSRIEALLEHQEKRVLVWAVTGAGKTEIMFPVIQK
jgi:competence protein ComFA